MGQYSRIVYAYTYFDALVAHGGWDDWDHKSNKSKYVLLKTKMCKILVNPKKLMTLKNVENH